MMRTARRAGLLAIVLGGLGVVAQGCLSRPLVASEPQTVTTFANVYQQDAIDKVDLLFVIDNSASMGDKQQYLSQAVPDLITRLVTPNCVDAATGTNYGSSQSDGSCPSGGTVEFPPVHDMHIGVLSTSLGTRLSDQYSTSSNPAGNGTQCSPDGTLTLKDGTVFPMHNDDRGELLNRTNPTDPTGAPLTDAGTAFYLNWFPASNPKNQGKQPSPGAPAISDAKTLTDDFTALITGVGSYGCGIESQLESWYRFLVQPDPYDSMTLGPNGNAQWSGVDSTILKQRQAFLRPDSLVAIIDMTDENDSEVDVRAVGGKGYWWMAADFDPPTGTPGCAEDAANDGLTDPSSCTSCGYEGVSCTGTDDYSADNDWGYNPNLRHVHMEQKYGALPQFPIQRYVLGLTSTKVPDRNGEYPSDANGYQGLTNLDCTNPLFAAGLPDGSSTDPATLCNLPVGPRKPDLVYYAHIGGVPHQLLQQDPTNPDSPPKETLEPADWTKILGSDPEHYDYSGIDPHMIESYQPRAGVPAAPAAPDADGVSDWVTDEPYPQPATGGHVLDVDREYACTFPLATARDCTDTTDPTVHYACDCPSAPGLSPQEIPPLCSATNPTQQIAAKAYPTQRELWLAQLMGPQGFVSSLCPIHVQPAQGQTELSDPLFGYNPAVNGIVDRLKVALGNQCLPQKLEPDECGDVQCLILVTLASSKNGEQDCTQLAGMSIPQADILAKFQQQQHDAWADGGGSGTDPSTLPTCQLQELSQLPAGANPADCAPPIGAFDGTGSCAGSTAQPGWCYVTGTAANGCDQAILFSNGEPPSGATVSLQCIEASVSVVSEGGAGGG